MGLMHNKALWVTLMSGSSAIAISDAATLLANETNGLALDFTDDFWQSSTGFYGSARIKDVATPANEFNSSPTQTASSLLTYTSPSVKMCMGPSGTLRYGAHQLWLYSEALASATLAYELNASVSGNVITVSGSGAYEYRSAALSIPNGSTVSISATVTCSATKSVGFRAVDNSDAELTGGTSQTALAMVAGVSQTVTLSGAIASAGAIKFGLDTRPGTVTGAEDLTGATVTITNVHLRRTPSDSTYLATTAAARYALPLEWSSAGVLQGLLVEESRTNLILYSSTTLASGWTATGLTNLTTTTTGADGVSGTATQLNEDTSTGGHNISQNVAKAASAITYTFSFIAKVGTGRTRVCAFLTTDSFANYFGAAFDLSGGQTSAFLTAGASPWTSQSKTITSIGGGQYLCTLTGTSNATSTTVTPYIYSDNGSGTAAVSSSFTGVVGNGCYVGDIQLEVGAFATSRIRTFASTVTRAADNISLATSAFPYSATVNTVFAEYNLSALSTANVQELVTGATTDIWRLYANNTGGNYGFTATTGGSGQGFTEAAGASAGVTAKLAVAMAANDVALVRNGGTPLTDATFSVPTVGTVYFGLRNTGLAQLNGLLKRVVILPRRMTNAELQTLTT